jgi:energy-coupling factor transporter ATP-binding protein EcfA2
MQRPAIEFEDVSYKYPGTKELVLENVNLKIPRNSFYVIAGPIGSGKTTLLMLARGFHKEYGGRFSGKIKVLGKDTKNQDISHLGNKVGIIFQNPALQLHQLRVIDEVMSAPMYQGLPYEECRKRAEDIVDKVLGKEFYQKSPSELSSGQQQKVALAACLAMKCRILLLDEPFSFLDTKKTKEVMDILQGLKKKGMTIVVATHGIEDVAGYADRIAVVDGKGIAIEGKVKDVLYDPKFDEIMTAPLSVKAAKMLIDKGKLKGEVADWGELLSKVKLKDVKEDGRKSRKKPYLEIKGLDYHYPGNGNGVSDVSFEVGKGEVFGIVGHNGSGKTTLAKLIMGVLKPKSGIISIAEHNMTRMDVHMRARRIGYVTQDPIDMFFESSVLEECSYGPKCFEFKEPERKAKKALKEFGLTRYETVHSDSLSGGQKRLLSIACILVNDPEILIIDEPEFGLDPKNRRMISQTVRRLRRKGKSTIIITQDLEIALFLCDRIGIMNDGRMVRVGRPKDLFSDDKLLEEVDLLPLPVFKALGSVSSKDLASEEAFIRAIDMNSN